MDNNLDTQASTATPTLAERLNEVQMNYPNPIESGSEILIPHSTSSIPEAFERISLSPERAEHPLTTLRRLMNSGACTHHHSMPDAHLYTRTDIRTGLKEAMSIDVLERSSLSLAAVEQKILEMVSDNPQQVEAIKAAFHRIENDAGRLPDGSIDDYEPETEAHVIWLIESNWSLASYLDEQPIGDSHRGIMASALSDNIVDGGGCNAGIVARLYPNYLAMLNAYHEHEACKALPFSLAAIR